MRKEDPSLTRIGELLNHAPVAIWVNYQNKLVFANKAAIALLGATTKEQLVGRSPFDFIHPDSQESARLRVRNMLETGDPVSGREERFLRIDGRPVDVEVTGWTIPFEEGRAIQLSFVDLTARKAAEEQLRDREQQFRTLADSIPQLAWMANPDGYIFWYNQRWFQYTGTTFDQMRGWGWTAVHDPHELPRVMAHFKAALESGEPWQDTFPLRRNDGEMRWHLSRALPVRDARGRIIRWFGTNTDVTELRQAEAAIRAGEARFKAAVEAVADIIWTNDRDGQMRGEQPDWSAFTGQTKEEFEGYGWAKAVHPEEVQSTLDEWNTCVAEKRTFIFEHRVRRYDGVYRLFSARGVPVLDEDGRLKEWVGVHTDITDQREAERKLRTSEARKTSMLESALDGIISIDSKSRILEFNPAAEKIFGYRREEVINQRMPDIMIPDRYREAHYRGMAQYLKTEYGPILGLRLELYGLRADGSEVPIELAVSRMPGDGEPLFTATLRDITYRKEAEEQLRRAKEEAEEANQTKSLFLASMSHELRTPLNAILGYGEMLQEEAEELGTHALVPDLKKIHSAGKHLLSLINEVLDLAKIEAGRMEVSSERFAISEIAEEVAQTVRPLVEKNRNQFALTLEPELGEMEADLTKLRQSLFNLLSNAAKFTHEGSIALHVERESASKGEWIRFTVRDTGIGISEEQREHLFEPFQQAEPRISQQYGGTGLGLSLTRSFCRMMGGDVTVESQFGKGSSFTIRLPRQTGQEMPIETSRPKIQAAKEIRGTVLVVDDDPTARDLIQRMLIKEGYRVETAETGEEGLTKARDSAPMAITLDVMMPNMDGWSVLSALKADPRLAEVPVIMLTMVDDRNLGFALGAASYLTKPVEREQLITLLRKYRCELPPCRVLVVDDDVETRRILRLQLEREGWQVTEAGNGEEALGRLAESEPALILLDLMMPKMDGFEFAHEVRRRPEWREIPIVVLTAKDLSVEERQRLNGHVERILLKGAFSLEDLMQELRRNLAACEQR